MLKNLELITSPTLIQPTTITSHLFQMFESTGWTLEEPNLKEDCHYDLPVPAIVRPPTVGEVSEFKY